MEIEEYTCKNSRVKIWHKKNDPFYFHHETGPAIIYENGSEQWYYYDTPYLLDRMPLFLFLAYVKWELKKNGS